MNTLTQRQLKCAAQHFGPWWADPQWLSQTVALYRAGQLPEMARGDSGDDDGPGYEVHQHIARISIIGSMTKGVSSFGGTSMIRTRQALRHALADDDVRGILLMIDSPGGTVSGCPDLAADVVRAAVSKPVVAHIDDQGASAAYYVAAGADRITANANALVGSLGTIMVIEDSSAHAEKEGVTVHALTTGPHKAFGVDGVPITEKQLVAGQEIVDDLGEMFISHVNKQRGLSIVMGADPADGHLWIAPKAMARGLIDAVQPYERTLADLAEMVAEDDEPPRRTPRQREAGIAKARAQQKARDEKAAGQRRAATAKAMLATMQLNRS